MKKDTLLSSDCDTMWIWSNDEAEICCYEHSRIILCGRYTASVGREENVMQLITVDRK